MKKLFLFSAILLGAGQIFAATWTISTSCGTTVTKEISDSATVDQVKAVVSQVNYNECGVRPAKIVLTL
ncbi:hypothetical protein [Elizabethkingia meningoseptica]|uniref:hypothetical protein n=1 Tax=Elizabethkingia meningoseptica TaxID=238 RepID=UPI0038925C10